MRLSFAGFFATVAALFLTGCSVDHTGLLSVDPGVKYQVNCVFNESYTRDSFETRSRSESNSSYCFNGEASNEEVYGICVDLANEREIDSRASRPDRANFRVVVAESGARRLTGETCSIVSGTPAGVGQRIDGLSTSGIAMNLDESGRALGDSTFANTQASFDRAQMRVSAKFAAWRHADETGKGRSFLDVDSCPNLAGCSVVLRYFDLSLRDFTIVRPTGLAKDVKVRNAKLYTLSNVETTTDASGAFVFRNVKAVVSAVVNGERVAFISEKPTVVRGRLDRFRGGRGVAPQRILLSIDESTHQFAVRGTVVMDVSQNEAVLQNRATGRCLAGTTNDAVVSRATVESCGLSGRSKAWRFVKRGNAVQIRQAYSSACLNLKTGVDNREGGAVHLVGCSTHRDQLWTIASDGHIRHLPSGKCLNVHAGRENRDGGVVSVYSCANASDQRWAFIGASR